MKANLKRNNIEGKCDVCNAPVMKDSIGNGDICSNCGWDQCASSHEFPDRVECPNFVSLNKAKELYQKGLPFIPDFQDFIGMLNFYGEVEFTYKDITYGVCGIIRDKKEVVEMFAKNANQTSTYESTEDFEANAKIDGNLLKDIWKDVENANWLQ